MGIETQYFYINLEKKYSDIYSFDYSRVNFYAGYFLYNHILPYYDLRKNIEIKKREP